MFVRKTNKYVKSVLRKQIRKKERKTKKKLQEVKKDPTLAQEALEKAYKNKNVFIINHLMLLKRIT